jgi:hypothetical protein
VGQFYDSLRRYHCILYAGYMYSGVLTSSFASLLYQRRYITNYQALILTQELRVALETEGALVVIFGSNNTGSIVATVLAKRVFLRGHILLTHLDFLSYYRRVFIHKFHSGCSSEGRGHLD